MPDDKKVRPGQRLRRVSAEQWNGFVDAARAAGERDMGGQDEALGGYTPGVVLRVLNDSGGNLDQFAVVALGVPIVAHSAETELEAFAKPSFTGTAPTASTGSAFGVLQEPLPDGAIGRAMVAGVTWVLVDVTDAAHAFAAAADAVMDKLTSHATTGVRVLYKPAGTGDKWCLVRLGDAGAASGGGGGGMTFLGMTVKTSGTSFTTQATTTLLYVRAVGGGGGGGGAQSIAPGVAACGGGGGGGQYSEGWMVAVGSTAYSCAVGAAGAAGTSGGTDGGDGTDTTFSGALESVVADGGYGGKGMTAGSGQAFAAGGAGGSTSVSGDVVGAGTPGAHGLRLSGTVGASGGGGSCPFGGGGAGLAAAAAGNAGQGFGGGGGGGLVLNGSTAVAGGAGAAGVLVIEEYIG